MSTTPPGSPRLVPLMIGKDASEEAQKVLEEKFGGECIDDFKRGGLRPEQLKNIELSFEKMAEETRSHFGEYDPSKLEDKDVQQFIESQFLGLIASLHQTVKSQEPNEVVEASMSEAVFSSADDYRPILATDGLATCIGVVCHDPINKAGFAVHFAGKDQVETSCALLMERMQAYRKGQVNGPLLFHLRGGIDGMSEDTLAAVKEWIRGFGPLACIASEDVLKEPFPGTGFPKAGPGSIKIDLRTGVCGEYDYTKNPYSQRAIHETRNRELSMDGVTPQSVLSAITEKSIRVVYDPLQ